MPVLEPSRAINQQLPIYVTNSDLTLFSTPGNSPIKQPVSHHTSPIKPILLVGSPNPAAVDREQTARLSFLESHTEALLKINDDLKADLQQATRQSDTLRQIVDDKQQDLDTRTKETEELRALNTQLQNDLAALQEQCGQLSRECSLMQQRLNGSQTERTALDGTLCALREENAALIASLQDKEAAAERLRVEIKTSIASTPERSVELESYQQKTAYLSAQNKSLLQDLLGSQTENDHLRRLLSMTAAGSISRPWPPTVQIGISNDASPRYAMPEGLQGAPQAGATETDLRGGPVSDLPADGAKPSSDTLLTNRSLVTAPYAVHKDTERPLRGGCTGYGYSGWLSSSDLGPGASVGGLGTSSAGSGGPLRPLSGNSTNSNSSGSYETQARFGSSLNAMQHGGGPLGQPGKNASMAGLQLGGFTPEAAPGQQQPAASKSNDYQLPKTPQEYEARIQELENQLMSLNKERDGLDSEYARMPTTSAGRTIKERQRKNQVEQRLAELQREICGVRLELKKLGCR